MDEIIVRYLHFIGIITLVSALAAEYLLVAKQMTLVAFKKLIVVDTIYGVGAIVTLFAGGILWFVVGKPAEFYSANPIFHSKLTIFVVIGLLSTFPTYYLFRHRKSSLETIRVPKYIINIIRIELFLLLLLPLFGVLISRGIGLS